MAIKATSKGEIRPTTPRPVSLGTIEKRVRRHLAKTGWSLVKSRPGTRQFDVLGRYSIHDSSFELMAEHVDIARRARAYGLMADDEILLNPAEECSHD